MRPKVVREFNVDELVGAIGLVWGHINAHQYEEAYLLSSVGLRIWPEERSLTLMHAYAAVEVLEPIDRAALERQRNVDTTPWIDIILAREVAASAAQSLSS